MNKLLRIVACIVTISIFPLLGACANSERDYHEDVCVQLSDRNAEIVIREWEFLLGSGAEIYYRQNGKTTLLGQISARDGTYCPFQDGKYSIAVDGNTLLIKWAFRYSDPENEWREESFALPPS